MTRLTLVALVLTCSTALAQDYRETLSLNGTWDYVLTDDLAGALPVEGWQPIEVPGSVDGGTGQCAWFRRVFEAPPLPDGARAQLYFGGLKYNSEVQLNGSAVGGEFNGYDPFTLDVTHALRPGDLNTLIVGCRDWSGVFSRPVDLRDRAKDWIALRTAPADALLSPVGGLMTLFGPWDDVEIRVVPATRIGHVAITTSVRQGTLTVDCEITDDAGRDEGLTLECRVLEAGQEVLRLPSVPARETAHVHADWPDAHRWSYDDPHLYELETVLRAGDEILDRLRTRFGFRELWIEGTDFVLNGARIHMLASSSWPLHDVFRSREEVRTFWEAIKAGGNNAFRTHTQPWRKLFYDVADEVGILVIPEGAVWNDDEAYRINDPVFWENYSSHLHRMVRQYRNHPSVVMYSLENEFYGSRMNESNPYAMDMLADMGRRVKAWDPTRPITYESDGDPLGVADVIGLHYPHEYPDFNEYPNTCWWLERGEPTSWEMFGRAEAGQWRWDRRKPLYIGEFLWAPSDTPALHCLFYGDDVYTDYPRYHLMAKAMAWRMQIEGYRDSGVSGMCPWTEVEGPSLDDSNPLYASQREAYRRIAAFVREYNANFYGGETITRHLVLYNDTLAASDLDLVWTLEMDGKVVDEGSQRTFLDAGDRRTVAVDFPIPAITERRELAWTVTVNRNGQPEFQELHTYWAHPRRALSLPAGSVVAVYDPSGSLDGVIPDGGRRVDSLQELPPGGVGIVGPDAFDVESEALPTIGTGSTDAAIDRFLDSGGRLIVLEQRAAPPALVGHGLTSHQSTMAFAQMPDHPALQGISDRDLKWWADTDPGIPDHLVTRGEWLRPEGGSHRAIVTTGGRAGLAYAPLLELPRGRGVLLLSQLRLVERLSVEPTAARILQNLIDYAVAYPQDEARPVALIAASDGYRVLMDRLGASLAPDLSGDPAGLIILCGGAVAEPEPVRRALEAGATVLLHRPDAPTFAAVAGPLADGWVIRAGSGPVTKVSHSWLSQHLTHEDLYWLGPSTAPSFVAVPLAPEIIDSSLMPRVPLDQRRVIEAGNIERTGVLTSVLEGGSAIGLFTAGSVRAQLDFGDGGRFLVGGRLSGTPSQGIYPLCRVAIDGELVGHISVAGGSYEDYALCASVGAGRHTLTLSFENDASTAEDDRNLFVESLMVAPYEESEGGFEVLIEPGALAEARVGRGRLIVDFVRWDEPGANGLRASRYLSGLLTALGAETRAVESSSIELEGLVPDEDVAVAGVQGGELFLGTTGSARGLVRVLEPGGMLRLEIHGRGTAAEDQYPIVEVLVNGESVGRVEITSSSLAPYQVGVVTLKPGIAELEVRFTNDAYDPPEDRNVWLDRLMAYRLQTR